MLEREIEQHLMWAVARMGGKTWKFTSPAHRGVADRIVCLPDGSTWFVELKRPGGRLSAQQVAFAADMKALQQNYACLYSKEDVDQWLKCLLPVNTAGP
jgi:hypothetical protein